MNAPTITVIDGLTLLAAITSDVTAALKHEWKSTFDRFDQWSETERQRTEEAVVTRWTSVVDAAIRRNILSPEDLAMLQALYSRDPGSVAAHLIKVQKVGASKFMSQFYVGYGHQSIGDCGTTTIFIEGVSMLAAKAIQDWPLYSGQEASTRYMNFAEAQFVSPLGHAETQERWLELYNDLVRNYVPQSLYKRYPRKDGENEAVYEKAIRARAFDICRGFLPAGTCTNLSWHTNLRQASDHLLLLRAHPLGEVRKLARDIWQALYAKYPSSFTAPAEDFPSHSIADNDRTEWRKLAATEALLRASGDDRVSEPHVSIRANARLIRHHERLLAERPRREVLPHFLDEIGSVESIFMLDYASFRDLQRHRNGVVRMPLLTTKMGFHPWYLEQLPYEARVRVEHFLVDERLALQTWAQAENLAPLSRNVANDILPFEQQYYIPMGYRVPCRVVQGIPAFIYRLELRSSKTVHPTLRSVVLQEAAAFREQCGQFTGLGPPIALYVDEDPDDWTIRRGQQDIEVRP